MCPCSTDFGDATEREAQRRAMHFMTQDKYQIRVKGHLSQKWSLWFDGLTITNVEQGEAILTGVVVDQAALFGILLKIRDLGLPLLAVNHVEPYREDMEEEK
jgi:hypothetical protein